MYLNCFQPFLSLPRIPRPDGGSAVSSDASCEPLISLEKKSVLIFLWGFPSSPPPFGLVVMPIKSFLKMSFMPSLTSTLANHMTLMESLLTLEKTSSLARFLLLSGLTLLSFSRPVLASRWSRAATRPDTPL